MQALFVTARLIYSHTTFRHILPEITTRGFTRFRTRQNRPTPFLYWNSKWRNPLYSLQRRWNGWPGKYGVCRWNFVAMCYGSWG